MKINFEVELNEDQLISLSNKLQGPQREVVVNEIEGLINNLRKLSMCLAEVNWYLVGIIKDCLDE